jgi:hypothetical protein
MASIARFDGLPVPNFSGKIERNFDLGLLKMDGIFLTSALALFAMQAASQSLSDVPIALVSQSPSETIKEKLSIPALTPLALVLVEPVSTRTAKRGDRFQVRLSSPLEFPGITVPAGTMGHGEVVHAQKAGAAGRAGELILAVRCLNFEGKCIKLRSLKVAPFQARDRSDAALAVGIVAGFAGFLVSGGHSELAAGSPLTALTAEAVPWPIQ